MRFLRAALPALLIVTTAAAEEPAEAPWQHFPIEGGCMIVTTDTSNAVNTTARWDQPCEPGQPIEGNGTLRIDWREEGLVLTISGAFVAGVPHGSIEVRAYDAATGALTDEESDVYDMGCQVDDATCQPYRPT